MSARRVVLAVPGDLSTPTGGYHYDRRLLGALCELGCEAIPLALAASFPRPSAADNRHAADCLRAVPADCPVIIDGLAMGAMDAAALSAMAAPIVALVHHPLAMESGLDPARREALLASERDNLARAAHVIVTSAHTGELLQSRYGVAAARITVARPGSDRPQPRQPKAEPPLILSVGALIPRKGHDVLLRALSGIADRRWQAVIAGAAHDEVHAGTLRELLFTLGLSTRVQLAGHVPRDELARLYAQATVFALATRYEGYGIVFDEAMTHGLPIASCSAGAVPHTVAPGAGRLVPPDDPDAFAAALAQILDDEPARAAMAAASAEAGAHLDGWDATARQVAGVLDRVTRHG